MPEQSIPCPLCSEQMRLARVVPGFAGHPELRSFECGACGEVITEPAKPEAVQRQAARR